MIRSRLERVVVGPVLFVALATYLTAACGAATDDSGRNTSNGNNSSAGNSAIGNSGSSSSTGGSGSGVDPGSGTSGGALAVGGDSNSGAADPVEEMDGGAPPASGVDGSSGLQPCESLGNIYQPGEFVPADCGGCMCDEGGSGQLQCLAIACIDPPAYCQQPFDGGNCDGSFPVFAFNADSGLCEAQVYGGCGGNSNRFESQAACEAACLFPAGAACEVGGVVYPSGTGDVPDPTSCNSCSCEDGALICTEINCPMPCPEGQVAGQECAACGPTDACEVVRFGCFSSCQDQQDCESSGGLCIAQKCINVCG